MMLPNAPQRCRYKGKKLFTTQIIGKNLDASEYYFECTLQEEGIMKCKRQIKKELEAFGVNKICYYTTGGNFDEKNRTNKKKKQ